MKWIMWHANRRGWLQYNEGMLATYWLFHTVPSSAKPAPQRLFFIIFLGTCVISAVALDETHASETSVQTVSMEVTKLKGRPVQGVLLSTSAQTLK